MPTARDSQRTISALSASSIECVACETLDELCLEITRGAAAALLTEESITRDIQDCLGKALQDEPAWSDFPLIVLTHAGSAVRHPPSFNVTLVERPLRFETLRSVVEAALRHRRHQYEVRDTLLNLTQAQKELKIANLELEQRVEERTHKLRETISELEAFSYTVSHDLRAPLRTIQGYAEALRNDYGPSLDDEGRRFVSKISVAAERLDLMVQDVLAYSRVAKGQIQLQEVNISDLIQDVVESYPQLREAGAITMREPFPKLWAHPAYLTQCISNLLGNAVKFVEPGQTPRVTIWAEDEPRGKHARVWFEDNGIGIAPEHFKQIFEIFGRVHPTQKYDGTGIGLAIVRKAVERMGGSVGLTSELGKGTRFWLSLKKAV
jgi:signal transduction histidine kinase